MKDCVPWAASSCSGPPSWGSSVIWRTPRSAPWTMPCRWCRGPSWSATRPARALQPHRRNLSDAQLQAVAGAGGLIGITLCPAFLGPAAEPVTIETVCDHLEHALSLVGPEAVAIGSDFDGVTRLPQGIRGVQDLPALLGALGRRGVPAETVAAVAGGNAARVLRAALPRLGLARGFSRRREPPIREWQGRTGHDGAPCGVGRDGASECKELESGGCRCHAADLCQSQPAPGLDPGDRLRHGSHPGRLRSGAVRSAGISQGGRQAGGARLPA